MPFYYYHFLSFALWKDTADEIFFKNAPVGSSTWRAYQKIKKDDTFVHSGEEGLQMILNDPKVSQCTHCECKVRGLLPK